jgi:hypothetical protein
MDICGVVLEAVTDQDLWICHAFIGMEGSHNDTNVRQLSPVFARLAKGHAPKCNYDISGHQHTKGYCLVDAIYISGGQHLWRQSPSLMVKKISLCFLALSFAERMTEGIMGAPIYFVIVLIPSSHVVSNWRLWMLVHHYNMTMKSERRDMTARDDHLYDPKVLPLSITSCLWSLLIFSPCKKDPWQKLFITVW